MPGPGQPPPGHSTPISAAEPGFEVDPVARRQHARRLVGADRDAGEQGRRRLADAAGEIAQPQFVGDIEDLLDAAGARHRGQLDRRLGVARLHAGLGVMAVVEHRDREVRRPLHPDRRQCPQPHQHLAVPGDHQDAPPRLGHRQAEPDHRRRSHGAPQIKIARVVADRGGVPAGRAKPGHQ